jgi:hypothetical protein
MIKDTFPIYKSHKRNRTFPTNHSANYYQHLGNLSLEENEKKLEKNCLHKCFSITITSPILCLLNRSDGKLNGAIM